MKADPAVQLRLLELQAADTELAQLAHRREHLPELAALAESDQQADQLSGQLLDLQAQLDDVADDQRRLENEVETVQTRTKRDNERLTAGGLPAKDLEGLQHEITTLARRQSALEDDLLDVMERRENVDSELAGLTQRQQALATQRADLEARRDAAFAGIDAATSRRGAERSAIAGELPADLMTLYDKIRASSGGVGAAMLRQRRCEGCHLELAGSELNAVRDAAPDAVVRCDNCRRILVRTGESGL